MDSWKEEYAKMVKLTREQTRVLKKGPKSLAESWMLNAMYWEYRRRTGRS